jgi:type IV pilus assembly protein PilM
MGIDLSAFAMIRALANGASPRGTDGAGEAPPEAGESAPQSAALYCSVGANTNLAVARGSACLFTRVSQFGLESIARELASDRELTVEHARQWLVHVGLEKPAEELDGDPETVSAARSALQNGSAALLNELRLSLEYYGAQDTALPVERVVLSGPGSAIPGLSQQLESGLALPLQAGLPPALEQFDDESAARLTLSYGLALEG